MKQVSGEDFQYICQNCDSTWAAAGLRILIKRFPSIACMIIANLLGGNKNENR